MNIIKCPYCGRDLIAEEVKIHECKKVVDYKIEGSTLWLFDGEKWYPRKLLSTERKQAEDSTDNETEPLYDITS